MTGGAVAVFAAAGTWLLVAVAATRFRPDSDSGRSIFRTASCIAVGLVLGGTASLILGQPAIAGLPTWVLVAALVVLCPGALPRGHRSQSALTLSAHRITFTTVVVATTMLASISVLDAVFDWPDRLHVAGAAVLVVAALAFGGVVAASPAGLERWLVPSFLAIGLVSATSTVTVTIVHLGFGDPTATALSTAESVIAAALAALAVLALHRPVTVLISQIGAGGPTGWTGVGSRLDTLLTRDVELDELLLQTCEAIQQAHHLQVVQIWTGTGEVLRLATSAPYGPDRTITLSDAASRVAASTPEPARSAWMEIWMPNLMDQPMRETDSAVAPVSYGGELRGLVLVSAAPNGGDLDADTLDVVRQVAQRLGSVIHNATLGEALEASLQELRQRERELRASRERLVAAADEERARIERDLHDGAQQQLVALAVNLQLAQGMISSDPEKATALLAELQQAARDAASELRTISHGIYPATLRDEGLGPALDEATAGLGVPVRVAAQSDRLGSEIEATAYFVCMEAIGNALKHASPTSIDVTVNADDAQLVFAVDDNGEGFDIDTADAGRGLQNMRDRLGAVGGTLIISSGTKGTRVIGTVPSVNLSRTSVRPDTGSPQPPAG